jgi:hypothetical protein
VTKSPDPHELSEDQIAEMEAAGIQFHDGIPIFPFVPDSIKESRFHVIEAGDLSTEARVHDLLMAMWNDPETLFYYYHGHDGGPSADNLLLAARNRGDILMDEQERRYYRHPKFKRDYVKIVPKGEDEYNFDWERQAVEKGPEFWRVTLKLGQRKRDELDAWRKVQLEEHFREQARKAQYQYDVFLSYAGADSEEATMIHEKIAAVGRRVFMAPKVLRAGDDFAEEIRLALHGSREMWLLVSPSSSASEWVITEWGAAWALSKRILPILHRCPPESLPDRLRRLQCTDLHRCDELIQQLKHGARS